MTKPSEMTPSEIDTILADLWERRSKIEHYLEQSQRWLERDEARQAKGEFTPQIEDWREAIEKHEAEIAALDNEAFPYEAEYGTRRWRRFFLVTNNNGHVHTSMECSTCFPETRYAWMPQYSGMTDEEIVERESYRACTVCLPIAPAEQKAARERHTREQREAKRAEREAKKNEKLRKQAERAEKFLAKVEKQIAKSFGSWDKLWAEYSLHGHDGKKSLYDATFDMPAQVGNYLYDEMQERETMARTTNRRAIPSRHFTDPKQTIAEAREKGLI